MFVSVKISLYRNLLGKKHTDLVSTMERLEEGVQKLKSTSAQVFGHVMLQETRVTSGNVEMRNGYSNFEVTLILR